MCDTSGMPMPGDGGWTNGQMDAEAFLCQSLATRFAYAINSKARLFFGFCPALALVFFQWQHVLLRGRQGLALYTNDPRVYVYHTRKPSLLGKNFFSLFLCAWAVQARLQFWRFFWKGGKRGNVFQARIQGRREENNDHKKATLGIGGGGGGGGRYNFRHY